MDFFYQFNLGFSQFLFMKSLKFFFFNFLKLADLWLVGEVVAIYGSKVAEGFSAFQRRSCYWIMPDAFIIVNGIFLVWDDTKYSCAVMWHVRFPQLNIKCMQWDPIIYGQYITIYHKTSNISCTLVGNKIVDHSDVVGASPVSAAPTTS